MGKTPDVSSQGEYPFSAVSVVLVHSCGNNYLIIIELRWVHTYSDLCLHMLVHPKITTTGTKELVKEIKLVINGKKEAWTFSTTIKLQCPNSQQYKLENQSNIPFIKRILTSQLTVIKSAK